MFQKIVVPLDGSSLAEQALPVAARLARAGSSSLLLLRIVPPLHQYAWYPVEPVADLSDLLEQERVRATNYLQGLTSSETLQGIDVSIAVLDGDPADTILSATAREQASLIVMCSHGETGFRRWMLGSVSVKVARHSDVPVLVLRPDPHNITAPFMSKTGPVRILVPLDGSERAEESLIPAARLAQVLSAPEAGALHLACVIPYENEDQELAIQLAQEYLVNIEQRLRASEPGKQLTITSSVTLHIDVAQALVELAEQGKGMEEIEGFKGCDLIAITTHGRGGVTRWVMGSVTERILDATKLPLLIIRAHKTREKPAREPETTTTGQDSTGAGDDPQSWIGLL
ncbi:MAG: universal stress protein [Ktedonobacteraceae bacterium]|nr:universal stress protein [Ktedonobacteraceae bacterium]